MPEGNSLKIVTEPSLDGITFDNQLIPNGDAMNCDN